MGFSLIVEVQIRYNNTLKNPFYTPDFRDTAKHYFSTFMNENPIENINPFKHLTDMKKVIMLFLLIVVGSPLFTFGQQNPKFVYCEIVGQVKLFSRKVTITVDFGEKLSAWADNRMKDEAGKPLVFNSMIDALNFMGKRGWQFSQAYTIGDAQNGRAVLVRLRQAGIGVLHAGGIDAALEGAHANP